MTRSKARTRASSALSRWGWFVIPALAIVLAACGQNGTYSY
jgi:hypothetical protein